MINIYLDSLISKDKPQVGTFNKLTLAFRRGVDLKLVLDGEVQVAFVLEEGLLNIDIVNKYFTVGAKERSIRFTIEFTLEDKFYSITRAAFDSMTALKNVGGGILLLGRQAPYKIIEGVGELINPQDFPTEFIKGNLLTINK